MVVATACYDDVRKHRLVLFPISLWLRAIFRSMRTYGGGNCLLAPFFSLARTIADPKSRVEIVCVEQVVGVYARQAMMTAVFVMASLGSSLLARAVMFLTSDNISSGAIVVVGLDLGAEPLRAMTDKLRKNRVNFRQNVSASLDQIFFSSDNSRERPELDDVLSLSFPPDISGRGSNLCGSAKTTATCSARDAEAVSFMEEMVETREEVVPLPIVIVKLRNLELTTAVLYQIRCGFDSSRWKLPCQVEEMAEAVRMARLYGRD
ncbi:hypothetical protein Bca4012_007552 [Brassica carinata]